MLVAYTQSKIVVPLKDVGSKVNLEADVLGKYVEQAVGGLVTRIEELEAKLNEVLKSKNS